MQCSVEAMAVDAGVWDVSDTVRTTNCGLTELARTASLRNSLRRSREPYWMHNVRQQLTEQLKSLDTRLDSHVVMLSELQDFYRRRSEVELEYSRGMDKLVRQINARHKTERQKREVWTSYSTHRVWQTLLETTRRLSHDHGVLGELYGGQMSNRITELTDDLQRIHKKCHEMALGGHDELIKVLTELHSSMKTYQLYHSECQQAEAKVRHAESQRVKLERQQSTGAGAVMAAKTAISRRFRNVEKQSEKKQAKYIESGLKAVKARNEYILCLETANAALQKYFSDDLHELITTMDYGYHNTLRRAVLAHLSADGSVLKSRQTCIDLLNQQIHDVDQQVDKQAFLEVFGNLFGQPRLFEFQPHHGDETNELTAEQFTQDELFDRMNAINERLNTLRLESEELVKSLETADQQLVELTTRKDYDMSYMFREDYQPLKSPQLAADRERTKTERVETENYYLTKLRDYQLRNNQMVRLQSKYNCIEKALTGVSCPAMNARSSDVPPKPKRRRALGTKSNVSVRPKLFGGTIQEYVEGTNEDIPLIIRSCVRIINLYGMHHQGVFRIPGPQNEINEFKNDFERGKDPLPDNLDGKDINSVAGVLKLYFRELKEPLFPMFMFDDLIACSNNCRFNTPENIASSVSHVRALLSTLHKSVFVVMKYLFAFLNHLSEYSDENLMDPYNLAICFGPTVLRVPADRDPVQFQPHIRELVRNIVIHQEDIFILDDVTAKGATLYEKCLIWEDGREDSVENLFEDDEAGNDQPTEEEAKEALAVYDFEARSEREISFHKGDVLLLHDKVSADWWEGSTASGNLRGLIPDKFIILRHREKTEVGSLNRRATEEKFKSTESLPAVKTCRLSVHPTSDDDLSASHPNVSLDRSGSSTRSRSPQVEEDVAGGETSGDELKQGTSSDDSKVLSEDSVTDSSSRDSADDLSQGRNGSANIDPFEDSDRLRRPVAATERSRKHSGMERRRSADWESNEILELGASPERPARRAGRVHSLESHRKSPERTSLTDNGRMEITEMTSGNSGGSDSDDKRTTEDLAMDIDSALAEVMSEIELLGLSCITPSSSATDHNEKHRSTTTTKSPSVSPSMVHDFTRTPDLVIGLPVGSKLQPPSPKNVSQEQETRSPTSELCSTFAKSRGSTFSESSSFSDTRSSTPLSSGQRSPAPTLRSTYAELRSTSLSPVHRSPVPEHRSSVQEHRSPAPPRRLSERVSQSPTRLLTTAEVFANVNQCTIKKGSAIGSAGGSVSSSTPEKPAAGPTTVRPAPRTSLSIDTSSDNNSAPRCAVKPVPAVRTKSVDERAFSTTERAFPSAEIDRTSAPVSPAPRVLPPTSAKPIRRPEMSWKSVAPSAELSSNNEYVRSMVPSFVPRKCDDHVDDISDCSLTAETNLPSVSHEIIITTGVATLPRTTATATVSSSERCDTSLAPNSQKPPVKVKPPVMKKPARAGEMIKRLQESMAAQQQPGVASGGSAVQ